MHVSTLISLHERGAPRSDGGPQERRAQMPSSELSALSVSCRVSLLQCHQARWTRHCCCGSAERLNSHANIPSLVEDVATVLLTEPAVELNFACSMLDARCRLHAHLLTSPTHCRNRLHRLRIAYTAQGATSGGHTCAWQGPAQLLTAQRGPGRCARRRQCVGRISRQPNHRQRGPAHRPRDWRA